MVNTKRVLYVLFYTSLILCIQGSTDDSKNNVNQPPISNPFININCCNDNSVNKAPTDVERIQNEWKKDTELLKKMKIAKYEEEQIEKKLSVKECKKEENEDIPAYGQTHERLHQIKDDLGFTNETTEQRIIDTLQLTANKSKREEILQLWKQYGEDMKKTYYANYPPYKFMELCAEEFLNHGSKRLIKKEKLLQQQQKEVKLKCTEALKAFHHNQDFKNANIAFKACHGALTADSTSMRKVQKFLIKECRDAITSFNFNQNEITAPILLQKCENILHPEINIREAMRNAQNLLDKKKKDKFEEELNNTVKHILGQNLADEANETKSTVDTEELEDADSNLNEINSVIRTGEHEEGILMPEVAENIDEIVSGTGCVNTITTAVTSYKHVYSGIRSLVILGVAAMLFERLFTSINHLPFIYTHVLGDGFGESLSTSTSMSNFHHVASDYMIGITNILEIIHSIRNRNSISKADWSLKFMFVYFTLIYLLGSVALPTFISATLLFLAFPAMCIFRANETIKNLYDRVTSSLPVMLTGAGFNILNIFFVFIPFLFFPDTSEFATVIPNIVAYIMYQWFYAKENMTHENVQAAKTKITEAKTKITETKQKITRKMSTFFGYNNI